MAEKEIGLLAVYSAQPTVRVNNAEVPGVRDLILGMEMTEEEGGLARLELRLSNVKNSGDGGVQLAFDTNSFDFGKEVRIYTGDESGPMEIFRGPITALEAEFPEHAEPELVILAEDGLQKARFQRKTKFHDNLSLRDLLTKVSREAGLTAGAAPATNAGPQMQLNESYLGFLRRLMRRFDLDAHASASELQCAKRQNVHRTDLTLEMHGQLRSARVVADLTHQATEVTVSGWNATQGQKVSTSSKGESLGPGTGRTGRQVFLQAFGDRSEHVGHLAVSTMDEARAIAAAAFDQRARGFVTLHGSAEGNPRIRVGSHLAITGLGKRFDNTYYVRKACHRYDLKDGYKTEFSGECAFVGSV